GSRFPVPETVDWMTPLVTVAVRSVADGAALLVPTTRTATTTAAAARAPTANVKTETFLRVRCIPAQRDSQRCIRRSSGKLQRTRNGRLMGTETFPAASRAVTTTR